MKSINKFLISSSLALVSLVCVNQSYAKTWKEITIATEGSYAPWNLTLPGGKVGGFEPELMDNLCVRMDIKCKFVVQNWDGMIAGLNIGKYDVIMDSIVITPEREKVIDFTIPYARTSAVFIANKGSFSDLQGSHPLVKMTNTEDSIKPAIANLQKVLKGKTIGIQSGTVYSPFIHKYFSKIAKIREYTSTSDAVLDLKAKRIDVVFDDVTFANAMLDQNKGTLSKIGPLLGGPIWGEGEAMGIRKTNPDLKKMLNQAISAALKDGTVKKLSMKWFNTNLAP